MVRIRHLEGKDTASQVLFLVGIAIKLQQHSSEQNKAILIYFLLALAFL